MFGFGKSFLYSSIKLSFNFGIKSCKPNFCKSRVTFSSNSPRAVDALYPVFLIYFTILGTTLSYNSTTFIVPFKFYIV